MGDDWMDTNRVRITRNLKMTPVEVGALIFAVIWVLICIVFFFGLVGTEPGVEKNGVGFVLVVASVLVPIATVWLAVSSARSARIMTDESERLQASMAAMRKVLIEVQEFQALAAPRAEERTRRLESARPRATDDEDDAAAMFASSRPHGTTEDEIIPPAATAAGEPPAAEPAMRDVSPEAKTAPKSEPEPEPKSAEPVPAPEPAADSAQSSLKFDGPLDEAEPAEAVDVDDLIRAINFPENAEDEAGFEALRRTLIDRRIATLIQASQDVLTLLSQDGIYMDDLTPTPAAPGTWRRFAGGQRGAAVAALGGISDRSSLALSSGRMKSDPAFRDATLLFLRRFDDVLSTFEPRMADAQLTRFATTRTARAFMLLARVTGTFD